MGDRRVFGALLVWSAGCGGIVPLSYVDVEAQRCVETALRTAPDPSALPTAYKQFTHACGLGDAASCSTLGMLYELGLSVEPDPARAVRLYARACEAGNDGGCANLGLAHARGVGVPRDVEAAGAFFARACAADHPVACTELGIARVRGLGVARDVEAGVTMLEQTCERGHAEACHRLARLYDDREVGPDPLATIFFFEKGCLGGVEAACDRLDTIYDERLPHGGVAAASAPKPDDDLTSGGDPAAVARAEAACRRGRLEECTVAGLAYRAGRGVAPDLHRATELLRRACRGGHARACRIVSPVLHGSCAEGDTASCRALTEAG
ncbi:MAG: tetratricopeptide repeat protein [Myxococcota bacterium]